MMPKSAVAERATITRLCARLPRRSLIIISVLRDHRGFGGHHDAVAGRIANHRDPGLEPERNLDRDLTTPRRPDSRAVPDVPGVWNGWVLWTASRNERGARTRIRRQRKAAAELALDSSDNRGITWQRRIKRNRSPGAFAGGVG